MYTEQEPSIDAGEGAKGVGVWGYFKLHPLGMRAEYSAARCLSLLEYREDPWLHIQALAYQTQQRALEKREIDPVLAAIMARLDLLQSLSFSAKNHPLFEAKPVSFFLSREQCFFPPSHGFVPGEKIVIEAVILPEYAYMAGLGTVEGSEDGLRLSAMHWLEPGEDVREGILWRAALRERAQQRQKKELSTESSF